MYLHTHKILHLLFISALSSSLSFQCAHVRLKSEYLYTYICVYVYLPIVYTHLYTRMYMNMYICILYTYIYTYKCLHAQMYIHPSSKLTPQYSQETALAWGKNWCSLTTWFENIQTKKLFCRIPAMQYQKKESYA